MMAWPRMVFSPSTPRSSSQAIGDIPWRWSISLNSTTDCEACTVYGRPASSARSLASRSSSGVHVSTCIGENAQRTRPPWAAPGLLVLRLAADGQHLEQPRVPELRAAAVLDERAIEGRAGDVRVGGDESRGQHAVARVQRLVDLPLAAAADVNDAGALHDDHAIAQQAVTAAVEGDDPARSDRDAPGRHFATIAGSRRITT